MTTEMTARGIPVTPEFKQLVTDAAWNAQNTVSEYVRSAIDALLTDAGQVAGWTETDPGNGSKRLMFYISDEQWEQLKAAGWLNRKSLAAVVRLAVQHKING